MTGLYPYHGSDILRRLTECTNTMLGVHRKGLCYKGTTLQSNYRKMTMKWSFSYNFFVKLCGKIIGCHTMTVLYLNPGSNILRRLTVFTFPMLCLFV